MAARQWIWSPRMTRRRNTWENSGNWCGNDSFGLIFWDADFHHNHFKFFKFSFKRYKKFVIFLPLFYCNLFSFSCLLHKWLQLCCQIFNYSLQNTNFTHNIQAIYLFHLRIFPAILFPNFHENFHNHPPKIPNQTDWKTISKMNTVFCCCCSDHAYILQRSFSFLPTKTFIIYTKTGPQTPNQ